MRNGVWIHLIWYSYIYTKNYAKKLSQFVKLGHIELSIGLWKFQVSSTKWYNWPLEWQFSHWFILNKPFHALIPLMSNNSIFIRHPCTYFFVLVRPLDETAYPTLNITIIIMSVMPKFTPTEYYNMWRLGLAKKYFKMNFNFFGKLIFWVFFCILKTRVLWNICE